MKSFHFAGGRFVWIPVLQSRLSFGAFPLKWLTFGVRLWSVTRRPEAWTESSSCESHRASFSILHTHTDVLSLSASTQKRRFCICPSTEKKKEKPVLRKIGYFRPLDCFFSPLKTNWRCCILTDKVFFYEVQAALLTDELVLLVKSLRTHCLNHCETLAAHSALFFFLYFPTVFDFLCPGPDKRFRLPSPRPLQHDPTGRVCSHCRPQRVSPDSRNYMQVVQWLAK